jgi:capsular polysaccharide biosynthesis protein
VKKFFMPNDLAPIPCFVWETVELLGLSKDALIPIDSGVHHAAELCFVHGAQPSTFTCELTKSKLSSVVGERQPTGQKKVFLVRKAKTSTQRALVNEGDVVHLCAQMGIEAVDPGALSLREQIALFQNVNLVIGVHGAAFANMLWMPPRGKVIEIATGMQPHYRTLAANLSMTWMSLLARNADPSLAEHNGMFVVNQEALEKLIQLCSVAVSGSREDSANP